MEYQKFDARVIKQLGISGTSKHFGDLLINESRLLDTFQLGWSTQYTPELLKFIFLVCVFSRTHQNHVRYQPFVLDLQGERTVVNLGSQIWDTPIFVWIPVAAFLDPCRNDLRAPGKWSSVGLVETRNMKCIFGGLGGGVWGGAVGGWGP